MSNQKHHKIVGDLIKLLDDNKEWKALLASSVRTACIKASEKLSKKQWERFKVLPNNKKNSKKQFKWLDKDSIDKDTTDKETLDKYYEFLNAYVEWIPTEKGHDEHVDEILFQFARFYWLIDQPDGLLLQGHPQEPGAKPNAFTQWMVDFAKKWGSFLNTPESLTPDSLNNFYADPTFNLTDYIGSVSADEVKNPKDLDKARWKKANEVWKSFNQIFSRSVKPGLRPISGMFDDRIICAPADFTLRMKAKIDNDSTITVKQTHTYSVMELLDNSPYRDRFKGGLFMHGFLSTFDFHRFMAPVRGTVLECRPIQAEVYLGVDIITDTLGMKTLYVEDETGYQFVQTRGLIIWDSPVGLVAALPMGMSQVSSVNMTAVKGSYLNKGDEFGYFMFGGSDMILLFEAGSDVTITAAPGIHTNAGMCIGEVIHSTV